MRAHLEAQLPLDLGDLVLDLHHGRIVRLEGLELLLIFRDQQIALVPQSGDHGVGEQLRHVDCIRRLDLAPQLLVPDAL